MGKGGRRKKSQRAINSVLLLGEGDRIGEFGEQRGIIVRSGDLRFLGCVFGIDCFIVHEKIGDFLLKRKGKEKRMAAASSLGKATSFFSPAPEPGRAHSPVRKKEKTARKVRKKHSPQKHWAAL